VAAGWSSCGWAKRRYRFVESKVFTNVAATRGVAVHTATSVKDGQSAPQFSCEVAASQLIGGRKAVSSPRSLSKILQAWRGMYVAILSVASEVPGEVVQALLLRNEGCMLRELAVTFSRKRVSI